MFVTTILGLLRYSVAARGSDGRLAISVQAGLGAEVSWLEETTVVQFIEIPWDIGRDCGSAGHRITDRCCRGQSVPPGSDMGSGMMEHGGKMNMMQQMSQMMDSCNTMMQRTPDPRKVD
jgi:hypothetical protein